jgi:hypothetical protein
MNAEKPDLTEIARLLARHPGPVYVPGKGTVAYASLTQEDLEAIAAQAARSIRAQLASTKRAREFAEAAASGDFARMAELTQLKLSKKKQAQWDAELDALRAKRAKKLES